MSESVVTSLEDASEDASEDGGAATVFDQPGSAPPPGRRIALDLLVLAGPIIAAMISNTVMSFVDFVMVSQLGEQAQAAIMPAGILLFCVVSFGMGTLSVVNSFVSQSLGRGNLSECAAYAWQGIWLSLGVALCVMPAWIGIPALFAAVGHAPAVQAMEIIYVRIGLLGLFPMMASIALEQFFNGIHRPMVGFWAALTANLFNGVADYALIFGHFGFAPHGIGGAAVATQCGAALQMAVLLGWMLRPTVARRFDSRRRWRLSLARLRRILGFGLPAGFQFMVDVVSFAIFTLVLIGQFGTAQLAANNIAFKFLEIAFMPTIGLGIAVTAAVGKALGQDDPRLARRITRWAAGMGMIYMGLVALGYILLRHPLIGLLTDDAAVAGWAGDILLLCAAYQVFDAMNIIHVGALRGAGDTRWPAVFAAGCAATVFLGGGYAATRLVPAWGAIGPWAAATTYITILGLTFWARWRWGPWERIELLDPAAAAT